jgi:benzoyl-CoA reductase/2-hydroxyglutaryl-CoA dehydratase subunit BcrC/BadD/HgdB
MGKPFERTLAVTSGLSMLAEAMKENPPPALEPYGDLVWLMLNDMVVHYEEVAAAMADPGRKVAMIQFGLMPQLFYAFDCAPLSLEFYPPFFSGLDQNVIREFLESAEEAGVPPETCSTDRFIAGAALNDELPSNSLFATSSCPCDGTRIAYPIMQEILECPAIYLDAPFRHGRDAVRYYAGQLRDNLIPFLEEATGRKFDIDRFRETVVESNKAFECMLEINETYRLKPMPYSGYLRMMPFMRYIQAAGSPRATEVLQRFRDDALQRVRDGRTRGPFQEKHRVLWVHVPTIYDPSIFEWMEEELGAMVVAHLSVPVILDPIDTSTLDTMLEGVAWQGLDMTMSVQRVETETFLDWFFWAYDHYDADCLFVTQHVGCQSICGARGMIEKACREREVPVLFLELDYNDTRVLSPEQARIQIESFFETIMA